jgi:anion-transporting  ArsA/GET3 family ATPase
MVKPRMTLQSRIIVFCGKGGVGKTTLSLALGLRHAAAGRKVVVVSSHPLGELAVAVSLEGLAARYPTAARNLFVVHLNPKDLLRELVQNNFPVQWVARAVLDSEIYNNLVEVAPGLKEFYFLARLQQLAARRAAAGGSPDYDLLLWDAPATGHFLGTLRSARAFETYLTGPLSAAGADLHDFFSNAANIVVLPTTTLEEMAMQETVEMCRALENEFQLRPTTLLLNLVSPIIEASPEAVEQLQRTAAASSDEALRFALDRGLLERQRSLELRAELATPALAVERARHWASDLDLLEQLGRPLSTLAVAL